VTGVVDGLTFQACIDCYLVPELWSRAYVVLDTCSMHLNREIEEAIAKAGRKLIYLLLCSPEFSPIKNT